MSDTHAAMPGANMSHLDVGNAHVLSCEDCKQTLAVSEGRLTVWAVNRFRANHDGHTVVETVTP